MQRHMNQVQLAEMLDTKAPQISLKLRHLQYWQLDELVVVSKKFRIELDKIIHEDLSKTYTQGLPYQQSVPTLWNMGKRIWVSDVYHFQVVGPNMFFQSRGVKQKDRLIKLAMREWKKRFSGKGYAHAKRWSGNFMNDYLLVSVGHHDRKDFWVPKSEEMIKEAIKLENQFKREAEAELLKDTVKFIRQVLGEGELTRQKIAYHVSEAFVTFQEEMWDFRFSQENKKLISETHAENLKKGEPTYLLFTHPLYDLVHVSTDWLMDEVLKQLNNEDEGTESYEF